MPTVVTFVILEQFYLLKLNKLYKHVRKVVVYFLVSVYALPDLVGVLYVMCYVTSLAGKY